jgi:hypothetical protein
MIWLIGIVVVLGVAVGTVIAIGSSLPRDHVAAVRADLKASPDSIWAIVADIEGAASWRTDVKKVERLSDVDGKPSWREESSSGTITFVLAESEVPRRRVTRIADDALPFGGTWETVVEASSTGTRVTITERGFVKPALFRFMARYVFGYTSTLNSYLTALGAKLGEAVIPEVVASGR